MVSPDQENNGNVLVTPEQMLGSLAYELKHPLTYIARHAELLRMENGEAEALSAITASASDALMLIDSYMLSARAEYGQQQLPLEPVGIGGILYDVAHTLDAAAKSHNCLIEVASGHAGPVMAHAEGLRAALTCLTSQLLLCAPEEAAPRVIHLKAYKQYANDPIAAVFDPAIDFSQKDLSASRRLQGTAHMALGSQSHGSGIHLAIAESLAQSIGARLSVVRWHGTSGFGLRLIKSEQMQLV